ncbi:hypothetical protein [Paraburkholderia bonniea]|uniref:hypothetical protein n=1 Tax=Paraburkholderia bonniea TaxID=2152891 RepID=UPI001290D64F|nr:hypothetical protein [Paraburkholderia bonniea]
MPVGRLISIIFTVCLFLFIVCDPVEVLFYTAPKKSDLIYSSGVVNLDRAYKGGVIVKLKTKNGKMIFVCRSASMNILQSVMCPFSNEEIDLLDKKHVTVGWYKQNKWPLTSSELQVFVLLLNDRNIFSYEKMVDFYNKKNKEVSFGFVTIFIGLFAVAWMAKSIFEQCKVDVKNAENK